MTKAVNNILKSMESKGVLSNNTKNVKEMIQNIQRGDYIDYNSFCSTYERELVNEIDIGLLGEYTYVTELMYIVDADNMVYFRAVRYNDDGEYKIVINNSVLSKKQEYELRKYVDSVEMRHNNLYFVTPNKDSRYNVFAINNNIMKESGNELGFQGIDIFLEDITDALESAK